MRRYICSAQHATAAEVHDAERAILTIYALPANGKSDEGGQDYQSVCFHPIGIFRNTGRKDCLVRNMGRKVRSSTSNREGHPIFHDTVEKRLVF